MRLGVLDVGSNTVHFLVVDAHPGAAPLPAYSHKAELRLAELLDEDGAISEAGIERLVGHVASSLRVAEDKGVVDILPFATSAVREAANGEEVLRRVAAETGVELRVLSGQDEARLTFRPSAAGSAGPRVGCSTWTSAAARWRSPAAWTSSRTPPVRCRWAPGG